MVTPAISSCHKPHRTVTGEEEEEEGSQEGTSFCLTCFLLFFLLEPVFG